MMLNLYVQQHQWIIVALLSGVALMLIFCLTYAAMWRPRGTEEKSLETEAKDTGTLIKSFLSIVPWVLILLIVARASFTVLTLVVKTCKPPNW